MAERPVRIASAGQTCAEEGGGPLRQPSTTAGIGAARDVAPRVSNPYTVAQCYRLGANSVVYKSTMLTDLVTTVTTLVRYWLNMKTMPRD
jgi:hypothetical protein